MRVIIAGSRHFDDYELLKQYVDYILQDVKQRESIEIVSGNARGADALGERYAAERGYPVSLFPADWDKFGRRAGPMRNEQMGDYADALIAFGMVSPEEPNTGLNMQRKRGCGSGSK